MTDLPVPPNVPEWFMPPEFYDALGRIVDTPTDCCDFIRAAVYAQLWRDEDTRINRSPCPAPRIGARKLLMDKASHNAETCAQRARELMK